jgi:predicted CXXCH cytochrome family protein
MKKRILFCLAVMCALGAALVPDGAAAAPKFKKKDCLDCHKELATKVSGLKHAHQAVKKADCESCHLRHGVVPKLLLKQQGNALCLGCHAEKSIGMNKPHVHAVLKTGSCTKCHDAHGSNAPKMLKAEGAAACYTCHDKKAFERKNVHAVVAKDGCRACHAAHAADQKQLLLAEEKALCTRRRTASRRRTAGIPSRTPLARAATTRTRRTLPS